MPVARRKAPTFFHGRLRLLGAIAALFVLGLSVQGARLVLFKGEASLKQAEKRLRTHRWLPTWRGAILDRNGTVLARDEPRWAAAVAWGAITGTWADEMAAKAARGDMGQAAWSGLDHAQRQRAIDEFRAPFVEALDELWAVLAAAGKMTTDTLDERLRLTRRRVQKLAAVVWDRQRTTHTERVGPDGPTFKPRPIAEHVQPHILLGDIDDGDAIGLRRFADDHQDLVDLRYVRRRVMDEPTGTVTLQSDTMPRAIRRGAIDIQTDQPAAMVVGRVRNEVWQEDIERRPFRDPVSGDIDRGGYRLDDIVGASGMERAAEDVLRGDVGLIETRRDTGDQTREPAVAGADVQLTIDAKLQRRIEAILDPSTGLTQVQPWHNAEHLELGTRLPASVVVLDIPTGEILAMASTPGRAELADLTMADRQALTPWLIRPAQVVVPPGSIVKPLILAAAAAEGLVASDELIDCNGYHFPGHPRIARCWVHRPQYGMATHGPLGAREALARSCNCFFYELGERLGLERLALWYGIFGLNTAPDIGLTSPDLRAAGRSIEAAGMIPDQDERSEIRRRGEGVFEAIAQAIGQGKLGWTPLHAADAFATLARGGVRIEPTLVMGHTPTPRSKGRTLPPDIVDAALAGMTDAVREHYGTAARLRYAANDTEPLFRAPGVRLLGKTGTAQAPPWVRDVDGDGVIAPGERVGDLDHAWFVGLVDDDAHGTPRYAIAVLVEYGGSGGRAAGPIADQVVRALQAEGWLSGDDLE